MPTIPANDAPKGLALAEPDVVEKNVDVLIVGGGMGACGAAFEACRWADKAGVSVMLIDKAALERSGAVARACPPSIRILATIAPTTMSAW